MQEIDITNRREFTRGVARYSHIATDAKTGVQAWRRVYALEPWRDKVEFIIPQGGKYYPEEAGILRRVSVNDAKLAEKIDFYLEHGLAEFYPGDERKSIFDDENQNQ